MALPPDTIRVHSILSDNQISIVQNDSAKATITFTEKGRTKSDTSTTADAADKSAYQLGRNVGKVGKEVAAANVGVLVMVLISIPVVRGVSRFANLKERLPGWNKLYFRLWMLGFGYYLLMIGLQVTSKAAYKWYELAVYGATAAVLLAVRNYRPARTLLVGFLPATLASIAEVGLHHFAPHLLKRYESGLGTIGLFSLLWLLVFIFIARSHKKQAEKERVEREAAALEKQRIEAQNAALEQMVAERTATLTEQTEQLRRTLDELKATQNQLIQSEKMASLGELTAGIAHEIQNPLNFVTNFADVSNELLDELEEEQQRPARDLPLEAELLTDLRQNLTKIAHHGQRAASIVRGMLEHSRASSGERAPTDLNQLADEYLRLAYHGLRAKNKSFNATLTTFFDPDLKQVEVVAQDLGRVLLNLFTNAFYAVQKRKELGESDYTPTVEVNTLHRTSGAVEIRVRDNGTGIPESVVQKIFQPFFTTKPAGEGTGLGLSLSYDIITKGHGGTLRVETQEGHGTEFIIELPG